VDVAPPAEIIHTRTFIGSSSNQVWITTSSHPLEAIPSAIHLSSAGRDLFRDRRIQVMFDEPWLRPTRNLTRGAIHTQIIPQIR